MLVTIDPQDQIKKATKLFQSLLLKKKTELFFDYILFATKIEYLHSKDETR